MPKLWRLSHLGYPRADPGRTMAQTAIRLEYSEHFGDFIWVDHVFRVWPEGIVHSRLRVECGSTLKIEDWDYTKSYPRFTS